MIRLGKESKHSTREVLDRAEDFFGPKGVGLELQQRDEKTAVFRSSGGHVIVTVAAIKNGDRTDVDIESREWDYQAEQFLAKI